jgi:hypothetical protein
MTTLEVAKIEQCLGVKLPPEYVEALSDPLLRPKEDFAPGLCEDVDKVIRDNLDLRANGFYGQAWNPNHIVIQDDGCGNYYFILIPFNNTIYLADHEHTFDFNKLSNLPKWDSFYELRYT